MRLISILSLAALGAAVAACSQPEPMEPPVIRGEPIFDKFGGITGCTDGVYVPGAAPQDQCLPPSDDCEPGTTVSSAAAQPCPPPRMPRDPGRDPEPQRDPQRDPTGASTAG